jgi:hypothetical protein
MDGWVCGQANSPDDGILRSIDGSEVTRYSKNWVGGADGSKLGECLVVQFPIKLE